eukprot:CAMPEP_0206239146 /NCGR_PEP_ID=MMETSP0047_2-20121206/15219_1 /ASSEMBLY_ACC=CAM_ASM_000192 /TAXON_ID=195065 /ORGANISM="Chroomonas mesostigmatica_cf, Strain CCMP1168" /LENGTH=171 /DNA_ID=CAMNT_0053663781 /DNA_START=75 /DNA_END=590 /DNA_ORIENTATION=-
MSHKALEELLRKNRDRRLKCDRHGGRRLARNREEEPPLQDALKARATGHVTGTGSAAQCELEDALRGKEPTGAFVLSAHHSLGDASGHRTRGAGHVSSAHRQLEDALRGEEPMVAFVPSFSSSCVKLIVGSETRLWASSFSISAAHRRCEIQRLQGMFARLSCQHRDALRE